MSWLHSTMIKLNRKGFALEISKCHLAVLPLPPPPPLKLRTNTESEFEPLNSNYWKDLEVIEHPWVFWNSEGNSSTYFSMYIINLCCTLTSGNLFCEKEKLFHFTHAKQKAHSFLCPVMNYDVYLSQIARKRALWWLPGNQQWVWWETQRPGLPCPRSATNQPNGLKWYLTWLILSGFFPRSLRSLPATKDCESDFLSRKARSFNT